MYSAHQSQTPVSLMWNSWWNSAGKRMLRYSQHFDQRLLFTVNSCTWACCRLQCV